MRRRIAGGYAMVDPPDGQILADFYRALGSLSFMLVGLWWVVIQLRFKDGQGDAAGRRHAYNVLLFFLAPGSMSVLSAIDPEAGGLWRIVFAITALLGLSEIALYFSAGRLRTGAADLLRGL